jgi:diguanylate cyclase (GGDEF)-like protein
VGQFDPSEPARRRRGDDPMPTPNTLPESPRDGEGLPDTADVLLIAHPENVLLGARYRLARGESLEIGRSSTADVSLPDVPSVSRRHALLSFEDQVEIVDLGSTNGTLVEDAPVTGRQVIRSGQRFQVGAVHFKLLHEHDVEQAYHVAVYELMMRDGLTGLYNRRKLDEEARRECSRASRYARPLSLLLFDVDDFKAVNDSYGHLRGDAVLQRIAATALDLTRTEEIVARIGGEEFAVLCPEISAEGAGALAERLRVAIAGLEHRHEDRRFGATCSFGVASWKAAWSGFPELFEQADQALYASKRAGRNRVTVAEAASPVRHD